MYYVATILLFLNMGVTERSLTGPFTTLSECMQHKQDIIDMANNEPNIEVYLADCFRKKEEHING